MFDHFVVLALTSFNDERKEKYYNKWDTTFDSDNFQCYGVEVKVNWEEIKKRNCDMHMLTVHRETKNS